MQICHLSQPLRQASVLLVVNQSKSRQTSVLLVASQPKSRHSTHIMVSTAGEELTVRFPTIRNSAGQPGRCQPRRREAFLRLARSQRMKEC